MELIKENTIKNRKVYRSNNFIRKYWLDKDLQWLENHVSLLDKINPNYVLKSGLDELGVYMDMKIVPGIQADKFLHTEDFVKRIYSFCLHNIEETQPYVHGDWTLSNMIIEDDRIVMIDWDNIGIYPKDEVLKKLKSDLISAFGELYFKALRNDSASI